jgi:beta-lactamase regulating signal transducer with metallopeptidase domain
MNRLALILGALAAALPLLVDSAAKGIILLAIAAVATLALWRASAATRHLVWLLAIAALVVLPAFSLLLPGWRILPAWATVPEAKAAPEIASSAPLLQRLPFPAELPATLPLDSASSASAPLPAAPVEAAMPDSAAPRLRQWLPALWVIGCGLALLRLALAHTLLRRSTRSCAETNDARLLAALDGARVQLGLRARVRILLDARRTIPMVWGVFRPRLLLPAEALGWDDRQLRSVLLHELAHLKRRDPAAQWLLQIAIALHWFNPLVWLAAWRLHLERERACDDLVLASGVRASEYAEHLLHIATRLENSRWMQACGLAMAHPSRLEGRLLAVLSNRANRRRVTRTLAAVVLALGLGVVIPIAMMRAAEEAKAAVSASANDEAKPDGTVITASEPGTYYLTETMRLEIRRVVLFDYPSALKATISRLAPDAKAELRGSSIIEFPEGKDPFAFAWVKGTPQLWLAQSSSLHRFSLAKDSGILNTVLSRVDGSVPAEIRKAIIASGLPTISVLEKQPAHSASRVITAREPGEYAPAKDLRLEIRQLELPGKPGGTLRVNVSTASDPKTEPRKGSTIDLHRGSNAFALAWEEDKQGLWMVLAETSGMRFIKVDAHSIGYLKSGASVPPAIRATIDELGLTPSDGLMQDATCDRVSYGTLDPVLTATKPGTYQLTDRLRLVISHLSAGADGKTSDHASIIPLAQDLKTELPAKTSFEGLQSYAFAWERDSSSLWVATNGDRGIETRNLKLLETDGAVTVLTPDASSAPAAIRRVLTDLHFTAEEAKPKAESATPTDGAKAAAPASPVEEAKPDGTVLTATEPGTYVLTDTMRLEIRRESLDGHPATLRATVRRLAVDSKAKPQSHSILRMSEGEANAGKVSPNKLTIGPSADEANAETRGSSTIEFREGEDHFVYAWVKGTSQLWLAQPGALRRYSLAKDSGILTTVFPRVDGSVPAEIRKAIIASGLRTISALEKRAAFSATHGVITAREPGEYAPATDLRLEIRQLGLPGKPDAMRVAVSAASDPKTEPQKGSTIDLRGGAKAFALGWEENKPGLWMAVAQTKGMRYIKLDAHSITYLRNGASVPAAIRDAIENLGLTPVDDATLVQDATSDKMNYAPLDPAALTATKPGTYKLNARFRLVIKSVTDANGKLSDYASIVPLAEDLKTELPARTFVEGLQTYAFAWEPESSSLWVGVNEPKGRLFHNFLLLDSGNVATSTKGDGTSPASAPLAIRRVLTDLHFTAEEAKPKAEPTTPAGSPAEKKSPAPPPLPEAAKITPNPLPVDGVVTVREPGLYEPADGLRLEIRKLTMPGKPDAMVVKVERIASPKSEAGRGTRVEITGGDRSFAVAWEPGEPKVWLAYLFPDGETQFILLKPGPKKEGIEAELLLAEPKKDAIGPTVDRTGGVPGAIQNAMRGLQPLPEGAGISIAGEHLSVFKSPRGVNHATQPGTYDISHVLQLVIRKATNGAGDSATLVRLDEISKRVLESHTFASDLRNYAFVWEQNDRAFWAAIPERGTTDFHLYLLGGQGVVDRKLKQDGAYIPAAIRKVFGDLKFVPPPPQPATNRPATTPGEPAAPEADPKAGAANETGKNPATPPAKADRPQIFLLGLDLSKVPLIEDFRTITDLWVPDPASPGKWTRAPGQLEMPVNGDVHTWLRYLPAKAVFYLERREASGKDFTYGPISGDPFVVLKLKEVMLERIAKWETGSDAYRRVFSLLHFSQTIQHATDLIAALGEPQTLDGYDDLLAEVRTARQAPHDATAQTALARAETRLQHLTDLREKRRAKIDPASYTAVGEDPAKLDKKILWGKPEKGLAAGLWLASPTIPNEGTLDVEVYLQNQSKEPIRYEHCARLDVGLRVMLIDAGGREHWGQIVMNSTPVFGGKVQLAPGFVHREKTFTVQFSAQPGETVFGLGPFIKAEAGAYRFHCDLGVPGYEQGGATGEISTPAAGEWHGSLPVEAALEITAEAKPAPAAPPPNPKPADAQELNRQRLLLLQILQKAAELRGAGVGENHPQMKLLRAQLDVVQLRKAILEIQQEEDALRKSGVGEDDPKMLNLQTQRTAMEEELDPSLKPKLPRSPAGVEKTPPNGKTPVPAERNPPSAHAPAEIRVQKSTAGLAAKTPSASPAIPEARSSSDREANAQSEDVFPTTFSKSLATDLRPRIEDVIRREKFAIDAKPRETDFVEKWFEKTEPKDPLYRLWENPTADNSRARVQQIEQKEEQLRNSGMRDNDPPMVALRAQREHHLTQLGVAKSAQTSEVESLRALFTDREQSLAALHLDEFNRRWGMFEGGVRLKFRRQDDDQKRVESIEGELSALQVKNQVAGRRELLEELVRIETKYFDANKRSGIERLKLESERNILLARLRLAEFESGSPQKASTPKRFR